MLFQYTHYLCMLVSCIDDYVPTGNRWFSNGKSSYDDLRGNILKTTCCLKSYVHLSLTRSGLDIETKNILKIY